MSRIVLDASAVLAAVNHEPGQQTVRAAVGDGAAISTVNLSEVVAKLVEQGMPPTDVRDTLLQFDVESFDFDYAAAFGAGLLRASTTRLGLSLGDRACVALASSLGLPVLTADRRWANLDPALGVEVQLIR